MKTFRDALTEEQYIEGKRLNDEARRESEPDEPQPEPLTKLERWCKAEPQQAARQIKMLQEQVEFWATVAHPVGLHQMPFRTCGWDRCRKLRERLQRFPA